MSIRLLINGAQGRMGQLIVKALIEHPDFTLVGALTRENNLAKEIKKTRSELVIDFTHAAAVLKNTQIIIDSGAHPVIGTSGLVQDQIKLLQGQCAKLKLGGIIAPNFSLGAILMMKYSQEIVKYFPQVEIIELHHAGKLDSPSGTAIRTAEMLAEGRQQIVPQPPNTQETLAGARGAVYQHIPIHSIRLPGLIAHEQIIFGSIGETLTIRCDTIDRQSYIPGIMLACQRVLKLDYLAYGLENILDLRLHKE